jgi:hypothetical protein
VASRTHTSSSSSHFWHQSNRRGRERESR